MQCDGEWLNLLKVTSSWFWKNTSRFYQFGLPFVCFRKNQHEEVFQFPNVGAKRGVLEDCMIFVFVFGNPDFSKVSPSYKKCFPRPIDIMEGECFLEGIFLKLTCVRVMCSWTHVVSSKKGLFLRFFWWIFKSLRFLNRIAMDGIWWLCIRA